MYSVLGFLCSHHQYCTLSIPPPVVSNSLYGNRDLVCISITSSPSLCFAAYFLTSDLKKLKG
ncbi:hypothetical protein RDI58_016935 [Solanum bulbocastanum]|uniref:Uncharacterized protein n=1 Tax=Solanum bulbocastanum TaxID=147425 RepID=A0AAN8YCV8_SOLBU